MEFYYNGLTVLCDPVFEDTCVYRGVKEHRLNPPPCKLEDIPFVDIVLISNSHPQHFSYRTIKKIHKIHPFCEFFVPRGCGDWFRENDIDRVTELDWYERVAIRAVPYASATGTTPIVEIGDYRGAEMKASIWCLPCQYESPTGPGSRAKGLWASWLIQSSVCNVYFCGYIPRILSGQLDTELQKVSRPARIPSIRELQNVRYTNNRSPQELCKTIRSLPHCIDLACIPIGGYNPRSLWSGRNCDPTDAVMMLEDLGAQFGLAIGYGTWGPRTKSSEQLRTSLSVPASHSGVKAASSISLELARP
ncbi:hypothetical protein H109_06786 [Trichophyton interdigitale MR816]|uniref:Metallo-beta-lactamase domain-containing protein n=1 Tax=Trichophyton interdigitale (strain MR816) TaxID=1215338 RepID=A0A059J093_TRIIM|nr:hypothetical protein H101_04652 [Trichophyton interdigitale H6]KDB21260.1 hypothetical protein H109_06786 [Trichophyton interdigitale MR816]